MIKNGGESDSSQNIVVQVTEGEGYILQLIRLDAFARWAFVNKNSVCDWAASSLKQVASEKISRLPGFLCVQPR